MTKKTMLLIPAEVVQALGAYLSNKPWNEVHEVMPVLQKLEVYRPEALIEPEPATPQDN